MCQKIGFLGKTMATLITRKWFLPSVNALVYHKGLIGEIFPTLRADDNLLTAMSLLVTEQDGLLGETFIALRTRERLFSRVNSLMVDQIRLT